jgi:predicted GTPase
MCVWCALVSLLMPFSNCRVSSHKLRSTLAKHSVRFFGTGGTASLLSRVKWAAQLKPRPPTFVLLMRGATPVDEGGQRFLANMLRQSLKLQGVPLRLYMRCVDGGRGGEDT